MATTARPIDGGTAIPTKDVVKTFRDKESVHGARSPFLAGITQYPDYQGDPPNPHRGETLPQAKQPMDRAKGGRDPQDQSGPAHAVLQNQA